MRPLPGSMQFFRSAFIAALFASFSAGCRGPEKWNVLVVTLDTTRADFLGCYGRASASTPNLDRLAQEGYLFLRAISAAPITLPSHSTIFTGTYPPVHGVRDNGLFALSEESTTLAEILRQQGYATGAAVGSFPVTRQFGLAQGFDFYDDHITVNVEDPQGIRVKPQGNLFFDERSAVQVNDAILPWLRQHLDRPFFAWIHYWDAHHPHVPPPPFDQLFANELYDGEIAFVDRSFGAVLRALKAGGVADRTIIVVVGDHGEGRGEHHEDTHSLLAYDSTLHVPLILFVPGEAGGRQIRQRVGTVDIVPTILDLLHIDSRPKEIQGRSLVKLLGGDTEGDATSSRRVLYAETLSPRLAYGWGELRALSENGLKYIHGPRPELFDLEQDPGETRNLLDDRPAEAQRMRRDLEVFLSRQDSTLAKKAIKGENAEVRARLAALGYLSGAGDAPETVVEVLRSEGVPPQDRVEDNSLSSYAKQKLNSNEFLLAREAALGLVDRDPESAFYRSLLAMALLGLDQLDRAAEVLADDRALSPSNRRIYFETSRRLFSAGQRDRAMALLGRMLGREDSASGRYLLAEMRSELGDSPGYERELRAALDLDPAHAPTRLSLAILLAGKGEREAATELFTGLLRDFPLNARYHFNYAMHLLGPHDDAQPEEAIAHLERATELLPSYWRAELQLLRLRVARGETEAAEEGFQRLETRCRDAAVLGEARAIMARAHQEAGS